MAKQLPNELITTKEQSTDNQFLQIEPLRTVVFNASREKRKCVEICVCVYFSVPLQRKIAQYRFLNQQKQYNHEKDFDISNRPRGNHKPRS